ncbi:MAG: hypothetical protein HOJ15_02180 [Candidatus Jacksonbacteria bacterium]|jgi:hypothetical protein|nr:hypothetical protein [Candidatus Jacksonbacteria bacterium]MBT6034775.1 hypothetical protein [Candidatus Jacksonbacteria bacterium]MBT6301213.1 hypothetical protein [Candidatus Jacksonbacteria bacterium]MBT6757037.1 hypothetical protein [Candidatus Jacksonbacteria bacterium]MBT6954816.1 hypothetical protein [Candidatus Jacksonbacteria bacterium]
MKNEKRGLTQLTTLGFILLVPTALFWTGAIFKLFNFFPDSPLTKSFQSLTPATGFILTIGLPVLSFLLAITGIIKNKQEEKFLKAALLIISIILVFAMTAVFLIQYVIG